MIVALAVVAAVYLAAIALTYLAQRRLLYHPNAKETPPAAVGLPQAERLTLATSDGERLLAWRIAPDRGKPMVVYFHGNGGGIDLRANRYRAFASAGFGVLAVEYRGYGGSTGAPSEAGLNLDAQAAYRTACETVAAARIVLLGESLGSGLAVALASRVEVGALVLDSPYTSIADVAASKFPIFPVRLLLRDRYASDQRIGAATAPLLIVHGTRDGVVPYRFGRRLFDLANEPKQFLTVEGAGHLALDHRLREAVGWIADVFDRLDAAGVSSAAAAPRAPSGSAD